MQKNYGKPSLLRHSFVARIVCARIMHRNIRAFKNKSARGSTSASQEQRMHPLFRCSGTLCVSEDDGGGKRRGRMEGEKRRTGKMCLFHTSYCPRRLPFYCLSQSRPLSFSGSSHPCRSVSYIAPSFISRVLRHSRGALAAFARARETSSHTAFLQLPSRIGTDSF